MKVGITATRDGVTPAQLDAFCLLLFDFRATELHHGDCVGGDEQAHRLTRDGNFPVKIVGHPPIKEKYRAWCDFDEVRIPKDYLVRNRDIVDETEVLIGMPSGPEKNRSGTWSTVRYARRCGKKVVVIYPDGELQS